MATLEQIAAALQSGTPGQALGISAAQTVEAITVSGGGTPSSATPQPIGTATAGTSTDYSRGDHVHAAQLADLSDVSSTAPTSGQVLAWGGSEWAPATPSTGTIAGTIAANQVAHGTAADTIGGAASLTFDPATQNLIVGDLSPHAITIGPYGYVSNPIIESINSMNINVATWGGALGIQNSNVDLILIGGDDGGGESYLQTQANVRFETQGRATIKPATDNANALTVRTAADVEALGVDTTVPAVRLGVELQLGASPGVAGEVLTSNGPGTAPTWQAAGGGSGPWQVTAGIISPTTSGDVVSVPVTSGNVGVTVADTGAGLDSLIEAGTITARDAAGFYQVSMNAAGEAAVNIRGDSGGTVFPKIRGTDFDGSPGALDLEIGGLTVNGAAGAAGEVLTSNGTGAAPTWQTPSGIAYIDHTINFTTTGGSAPNFTADHQIAGLDASASYLVDSCLVDNVGGSATQLALCAATVTQTAGVSTPTTQQQSALMGAWNSQLTLSSVPTVDGLTGTYAGPRQGFGSSVTIAPAVVVTDSAGRLNLRAFTGTSGGSFRAKIRLRKVSA